MNIIALTGNATKDVELNYSTQGTAFARGTIAVQRNFKNQNGEYDTDFINFKSAGKLAEVIANHVRKGDRFGITGSLQIDVVEKDGKREYYTNVFVNGFDFPQKRQSDSNNGGNGQGNTNTYKKNQNANNGNYGGYTRADSDLFNHQGQIDISDDDLPF